MSFWNNFNPFNHYLEECCKLLQIDINFDEQTLKNAYHKQVLLTHPDKGGKTENFIKISEAYKFLSSLLSEIPKRVKIAENPFTNNDKSTNNKDLKKKINELKPKNVLYRLEIELSDVYFGLKKKINLQRNRICLTCKKNNKLYSYDINCNECKNKKYSLQKKELELLIKKGVYTGSKIVFKGEGEEYVGHKPADIIFEIFVKENKNLIRKGNDLFLTKNITLKESLGIDYILISLFGKNNFYINKNKIIINPGDIKTVIGKGITFINDESHRGNLHITFNIIFPKTLNNDQKNIIKNVLDGNYNMYLNNNKKNNIKVNDTINNKIKRNTSSGCTVQKFTFNLANKNKFKLPNVNKEANKSFDKNHSNDYHSNTYHDLELLDLKEFNNTLLNSSFIN